MPKETTPAPSTTGKKFNSFQDLKIWQVGMGLCKDVYQATETFVDSTPSLAQEMRKTAVNYPAEVAQSHGYKFKNRQEYVKFLRSARGNLTRLEIQTLLAKDLGLMNGEADELTKSIHGLTKMTNSLIRILATVKRKENEDIIPAEVT